MMQKEQDLTVRTRPKPAAWALRGVCVFAAGSCARIRLIACALSLLACGSERPAWYGFPVLPPDAGAFELTPDLAARLLAAQAAFEAQPAAGHAAVDGGDAGAASTSPPPAPRNASAGSAASAAPAARSAQAGQRAAEMGKRSKPNPETAGAAAPTADPMQHTEASGPSGTAEEHAGDEHEAGQGAPEPPPTKPDPDLDAGIPADDADGGA